MRKGPKAPKSVTSRPGPDHGRRKALRTLALGGAGALAAPALLMRSAHAAGRTIKIGMVSPSTGPIAAFGEADQFVLAGVRKALGDGIMVAGEKHPVEIIYKDSQSNPNRASEVAAQLINNDRIDFMVASSTSDTTNPVSDQCELNGVPCVTSDDPWQSWFFGRRGNPAKGFEWTYHFFWGFDQVGNTFADMWLTLPTNKKLGTMFTNDPDGIAANDEKHGLPALFKSKGFDVHNLGTLPAALRRLHRADHRAEEGRVRGVLRHLQPAAIRDLLDPVRPAGLPAEDHDAAEGAAVSDRRRGAGRSRRGHVDRGVVVAPPPVQVESDRRDRAAVLRRLRGGDSASSGPSRSASSTPTSRSRSTR